MLLALSVDQYIAHMPDILRVFLAVWLFAVGGCVGSFLNVVVLRIPAGIGIARSGSRCPVCLHPIRWYDNIPIFSWLALRGRCRDCGTSISSRYPLVELLVAVVFLVVGLREGLTSGQNLPLLPDQPSYFMLTTFHTWSVYTFHVLTIVTLIGAALTELDCHAVAHRVLVPALLINLTCPVRLPWLHPVPAALGTIHEGMWGGIATVLAGLAVGVLMGLAAWPATSRQPRRPGAAATAVIGSALVGLCLGWQITGPVMVVTALAFLCGSILACLSARVGRGPWSMYVWIVLLLTILVWRELTHQIPWLGLAAPPYQVLLSAAVVLLISWITRWYTPAQELVLPKCEQTETREEQRMAPVDPDKNLKAILDSQSYMPVEYDAEFLKKWETRPVRVQLELLKAEIGFWSKESTRQSWSSGARRLCVRTRWPGSCSRRAALAQSPADARRQRDVERLEQIAAKSHYYDAARKFAELVSADCQSDGKCEYVIMTGGGPGIMEAANRGAYDVGAKSIGLNISLPAEQIPNPYITPELCFQFHYFALRKMHFLMRAKAMVVFPGGFGTLDELFDGLTLRQTHRMQEIPIVLFGREFWQQVINFQYLADEGVIADKDLELFRFAETPEEAWSIITQFHHAHA